LAVVASHGGRDVSLYDAAAELRDDKRTERAECEGLREGGPLLGGDGAEMEIVYVDYRIIYAGEGNCTVNVLSVY